MRTGLSLGRIFGIRVNIDWSWIFIFILVTWNLRVVFGLSHPEWSGALSWGLGVAASLLFFASVLAHELAHSLVARARGIPVRSITLFLFGGVSSIERDPESPTSEFLIAVVGPATSIILGVLLLLLAGIGLSFTAARTAITNPMQLVAQLGPVTTMLMWLGSINITLGIFNLIPGFPLDGGRVLRSILWGATNNLREATRWSSYVGRAIAWLFIVAGIAMIFGVSIPIFGTGFIGGLWLVFIGWFLNSAAIQSYQRVVINDILDDVTVERMMYRNPPTVPADTTITHLVDEYVMRADDHAFPVVDQGEFVGMVTLDDIRGVPRMQWDERLVRDIMTPVSDLVLTTPGEPADEAFNKLATRDVRQLPVMEGHQLVGLLRRRDVMRWLQLQSDFRQL